MHYQTILLPPDNARKCAKFDRNDRKLIKQELEIIEHKLQQLLLEFNSTDKNSITKKMIDFMQQNNTASIKRDLANYDLVGILQTSSNSEQQKDKQLNLLKVDQEILNLIKQNVNCLFIDNISNHQKGTKLCNSLFNEGICEDPKCKYGHSFEQTLFKAIIFNNKQYLESINQFGDQSDYAFLRQNPSFFKEFQEKKREWIQNKTLQRKKT